MEQELKFGLSKKDFEKLFAASKRRKTKTQINTYFDTPKLELKRRGVGLRVRIEDGRRAYLTLKCAMKQTATLAKSGHHSRKEYECRLPLARARGMNWRAAKTPIHPPLEALLPEATKRVRRVGTLINERTPIQIGRFWGELDAWRVGARRFYELEVETAYLAAAEKAVRARFADLGITPHPRASTKLATLFRLRKRGSRR